MTAEDGVVDVYDTKIGGTGFLNNIKGSDCIGFCITKSTS